MAATGGQQLVCIKRPEPALSAIFEDMYLNERLVDVTLSCINGQLQAHKLVLAACSPYFANLFDKLANPFHFPVIVIKDMQFEDLKLIVDFMYRGQLTISQERLTRLARSAKTLQINGLSNLVSASNGQLDVVAEYNLQQHSRPLEQLHKRAKISSPMGHNSNINHQQLTTISKGLHYPPKSQHDKAGGVGGGGGGASAAPRPDKLLEQSMLTGESLDETNRLHSCNICWKSFREKANLKRHLQVHSLDRIIYACPDCNKTFSWKDNYIRHTKTAHHMNNVRQQA